MDGPCKTVVFHPGKLLKATCAGAAIAFTLDEPAQSALAVKFTSGAGPGAHAYCMAFAGLTVTKDTGAPAGSGVSAIFKAHDALPPVACPVP